MKVYFDVRTGTEKTAVKSATVLKEIKGTFGGMLLCETVRKKPTPEKYLVLEQYTTGHRNTGTYIPPQEEAEVFAAFENDDIEFLYHFHETDWE